MSQMKRILPQMKQYTGSKGVKNNCHKKTIEDKIMTREKIAEYRQKLRNILKKEGNEGKISFSATA